VINQVHLYCPSVSVLLQIVRYHESRPSDNILDIIICLYTPITPSLRHLHMMTAAPRPKEEEEEEQE